jgi:hypothetical protein
MVEAAMAPLPPARPHQHAVAHLKVSHSNGGALQIVRASRTEPRAVRNRDVISGRHGLEHRVLPLIDLTTPTFLATAPALLCGAPALSCAGTGAARARAAPSAQIASDSVERIANVLLLVTNQNSPSY